MLSRALILATVTVVLGCFAAIPAEAQNLEAGKSPGQIFSSTCSLCHKSPRGLLKTVPPGSLPGFLRQHYTTSSDMASALAGYVMSNGAASAPVGGGNLTRQGQESKSGPKPSAEPAPDRAVQERERAVRGRKQHPREGARSPDADGLPEGAGARPEAPASAEAPPEHHLNAKQKAKQKAAKGRPTKDEQPKIDARHEPAKDEPPKSEQPKAESESAKTQAPVTEAPKREEAAPAAVEAKPDPTAVAAPPVAPKEPEKGSDSAAAAASPPAPPPPPSKPVEDNPNRPLTIDVGPPLSPPPANPPVQ